MIDAVTNSISSILAFISSNQLSLIFIGIILLLSTSGLVVVTTFKIMGIKLPQAADSDDKRYGIIFGKCENIIIYILILLEGYTALALIFTGKAIVRNEDKEKLSVFHLAGTMINTAYSILIAFLFKYLIGKLTAFK
ncbi:MAG: hypothetical protein PHP95_02790 [Desulfuromonadaceae bacterium]|nr:hypothetical protein [Desulfuromonadaceae bacterium]MDD2847361.1 hypothetical protein [Desulfuromonadaceae bacterium]MDD4131526.1 hypothetical protein [Desulfuromonadaceae bacterium]